MFSEPTEMFLHILFCFTNSQKSNRIHFAILEDNNNNNNKRNLNISEARRTEFFPFVDWHELPKLLPIRLTMNDKSINLLIDISVLLLIMYLGRKPFFKELYQNLLLNYNSGQNRLILGFKGEKRIINKNKLIFLFVV